MQVLEELIYSPGMNSMLGRRRATLAARDDEHPVDSSRSRAVSDPRQQQNAVRGVLSLMG